MGYLWNKLFFIIISSFWIPYSVFWLYSPFPNYTLVFMFRLGPSPDILLCAGKIFQKSKTTLAFSISHKACSAHTSISKSFPRVPTALLSWPCHPLYEIATMHTYGLIDFVCQEFWHIWVDPLLHTLPWLVITLRLKLRKILPSISARLLAECLFLKCNWKSVHIL